MSSSPPSLALYRQLNGSSTPLSASRDVGRIVDLDAYSCYANFKYRLWFIWQIWSAQDSILANAVRMLPWGSMVSGDLWLWEDEDEECIKEFIKDSDLSGPGEIPVEGWKEACRAFEARQSRTTVPANALSHLTPQTRLRFIAWLILAGPVRRDKMLQLKMWRDRGVLLQRGGFRSIAELISSWAESMNLSRQIANFCGVCRLSDFLPMWCETMLAVYSLKDLRSIPWDCACNCFHR